MQTMSDRVPLKETNEFLQVYYVGNSVTENTTRNIDQFYILIFDWYKLEM